MSYEANSGEYISHYFNKKKEKLYSGGLNQKEISVFEISFANEILNLPDQRLILPSSIFKNLLKLWPLFAVSPQKSKWAD